MIKTTMISIKSAKVGDWLLMKPYGGNFCLVGVIIKQTDDSYALMYLPECGTFPYKTHCNTIGELLDYLNGKFEFVEKASVALPISINTFQDVAFEENSKERQEVIRRIVKGLEKDESLAIKNKG